MPISPGQILLSLTPHEIVHGPKSGNFHHVMVTYGCATDEQKHPIVSQMELDETYLDGSPNIELWVDSKLTGLCAIEVRRNDPEDVAPELTSLGVYYHAILRAVVIRKSKRRMGFADYLSTAAAEVLNNKIFSFMSDDAVAACTAVVAAVFMSKEGETFFYDMTEKSKNNFLTYEKMLGRKVEMVLNAGF